MNVISEKRTYADGFRVTRFELVTDDKPSPREVSDSQIRLGYHPAGYGGPYRIDSRETMNGWVTIWECSGSCD